LSIGFIHDQQLNVKRVSGRVQPGLCGVMAFDEATEEVAETGNLLLEPSRRVK
jgi:hypothetical protein